VLLFARVLTQNGPAHVAGAWVLLHRGDAGVVGAALREHYAVDLSPVPNMLATLLLTGLLAVLGPDAAEQLLLGGFVVLLAVALRYALLWDPRPCPDTRGRALSRTARLPGGVAAA